jgi:DNA mismatch repair ATPase MutS
VKALLMHREADFNPEGDPSPREQVLIDDLGLDWVVAAMAREDQFLSQLSRKALLSSLSDPEAIAYRQAALRDCLEQPELVRELYGIVVDAGESKRKVRWGLMSRSPGPILHSSVEALANALESLHALRGFSDDHAGQFGSEAFQRLFAMIAAELDDAYLDSVADHVSELGFRGGVLISAGLGRGHKGSEYVLRAPLEENRRLTHRLTSLFDNSTRTFHLAPRDEAGARALDELRNRGINLVADAAAQSADHIVSFFDALRAELGFYVGCLNLSERLAERQVPTCFPTPLAGSEPMLAAEGLRDASLALRSEAEIVGNDVAADGKPLVVITGANQGGKSTFLRSVGLAQLMMQCGMFVTAHSYAADVRDGLFTHFKREEDAEMESGKLDEELARMSEIAAEISPGALLLCNESFAATNEREGSEIAREIIRALLDAGVKVFFVTHMYELAHGFESDPRAPQTLFLRAERTEEAERTFRLLEGEPLSTSFGADVFERVFGAVPATAEIGGGPGGD